MNKLTLFFLAAAAPLLIMGAGCAANDASDQINYGDSSPSGTSVKANSAPDFTAVIEHGVQTTGLTTAATKSYTDALSIYGKSGARFQFANCSGNPGSLNIKVGTKFMIDNRDGESHQIKIGSKAYTLDAYDFAIVSVQKIGSFNITCDGGGSAHVNVEK